LGALYWNPATISGLPQSELSVGMDLLFIDHEVASNVGALGGTTEGEAGTFPVPNVGWVHRTSHPGLTIGMGLNAVAGFKTTLPADPTNPVLAPPPVGLGRVSSEASFLQFSPVLSYAVSDRLSLAAGPLITTGQLGLEPFVFDPPNADGSYSSARATQYRWGGGFQLGMYYIQNESWRWGASLHSPTWMDEFEFVGEDAVGAPRRLSAKIDLPLIFSAGVSYAAGNDWLFALDARYFDYANSDGFGEPAAFDPATFELQGLGYRSVFALGMGVQRKWSERLYGRFGYAYNQNPVADRESFFATAAPLIYQHQFATSFSYQLHENLAVSFGYAYFLESERAGPVILPGVGAVPDSSVTNRLNVHVADFGLVMRL
jgi:long-chain fatty acid transport protein